MGKAVTMSEFLCVCECCALTNDFQARKVVSRLLDERLV